MRYSPVRWIAVTVLIALALVACSAPKHPHTATKPSLTVVEPLASDVTLSGEQLFLACAGCHALNPDAPAGVGPNLAGLEGRLAGNLPGFSYSPALQESGVVWNRGTLTGWILQTEGMVPGTWMLYHNHLEVDEVERLLDFILETR